MSEDLGHTVKVYDDLQVGSWIKVYDERHDPTLSENGSYWDGSCWLITGLNYDDSSAKLHSYGVRVFRHGIRPFNACCTAPLLSVVYDDNGATFFTHVTDPAEQAVLALRFL